MAFSLLGRLVDLYTFIENVVKHPTEKQISVSVIYTYKTLRPYSGREGGCGGRKG